MKNEIKVTKEQFERLIESVHNQKYGKPLREGRPTKSTKSKK
jgi:hypothetical protein